jgi:hypothetical protein
MTVVLRSQNQALHLFRPGFSQRLFNKKWINFPFSGQRMQPERIANPGFLTPYSALFLLWQQQVWKKRLMMARIAPAATITHFAQMAGHQKMAKTTTAAESRKRQKQSFMIPPFYICKIF